MVNFFLFKPSHLETPGTALLCYSPITTQGGVGFGGIPIFRGAHPHPGNPGSPGHPLTRLKCQTIWVCRFEKSKRILSHDARETLANRELVGLLPWPLSPPFSLSFHLAKGLARI